MAMYRNRYFLAGILLILVGIQFRMVDSFVLNEHATRALARVSKTGAVADTSSVSSMMLGIHPNPTKRIEPPRCVGLALITVGAIVSFHAIAVPKT